VFAKIGQAVFFGILCSCLYWDVGGKYDKKGITNIAGCNFFLLTGQLFNWLFGSLLTFQLEREIFLREQANNLYSPVAYFAAKNAIETVVGIFTPLLQLAITYWSVGYNNATGADFASFFEVYLAMLFVAQTAMGIGLLVSAISPNMVTANSIAPAFTMPMVLFGGFIANNESIPSFLAWI